MARRMLGSDGQIRPWTPPRPQHTKHPRTWKRARGNITGPGADPDDRGLSGDAPDTDGAPIKGLPKHRFRRRLPRRNDDAYDLIAGENKLASGFRLG